MKIYFFSSILLMLFISACTHETDMHKSGEAGTNQQVQQPSKKTSIKPNRSEVVVQILDKDVKDTTDFSLTVKVLNVTEDLDGNSIASPGASYTLRPALRLGGNKETLNDPRNKKLLKLKDLGKGDKFKAYIYMNSENQWVIQEVLD